MTITKPELIQFIEDNCYVSTDGIIKWSWQEIYGSQSTKKLNDKIKKFVLSEEQDG